MKSKKTVRKALWMSVLSIALCLTMLVGTTFAWFTDTASTAVNKIQSGTLDVVMSSDAEGKNSIEGTTLNWVKAEGAESEAVLWEPGCTYNLDSFYIVNKGNLALKYKVVISGIDGSSKLMNAIDFTITEEGKEPVDLATWNGGVLLPSTAAAETAKAGEQIGHTGKFTITGKMRTDAGNEYQGLSIDGVGITVYATQYTYEYDSENNQYDKDSDKDTAYYSLSEFNALTEIPAEIKNVYVNIGNVSLADSGVTIGNKSMADVYTSVTGNYSIGEKLDDGRVVSSVWNANNQTYLANTNKPGITLYISGSVNGNPEGGLNQSNSHSLSLIIPDASNVVFTKDFTVNGYFRCSFSWNDSQKLGGGVAAHKVQSVLFDHSTFNGIWIQNGGFLADSLTLDGCTFSAYTNKVAPNDSNPLWFCNTGSCNITVKNCSFTASRPIKLAEQSAYGTKLTVINNAFDMSVYNSANKEGEPKNDAIMLCAIGSGTLGDVVISGNKVENGTALMAFYKPVEFTMAEGASFTVSNNTLGTGVKTSVVWKSNTEFTPDFVK